MADVQTTSFEKYLTITASDAAPAVDAAVTDVPVLVRLSTGINGFSYDDIAANGANIAFGVASGSTLTVYPHEIETWDPDGVSTVWVKVPSLAQGTSFDMYYGGSGSVAENSSAVWSGYTGVWHMEEASGDCADSTGNALTAVASGAASADSVRVTDAPTGAGRQFATAKGNKTYLAVADCESLQLGDTFTLSGWFKAKACYTSYSMRYFSKKKAYADKEGFESEARYSSDLNTVKTTISSRGANNGDYTQTVPDITENWINVVWQYSGTSLTYYVNGQKGSTLTLNSAASNSAKAFALGNNPSGTESNWVGWMDEFRMRTGTLDAAHIAVDYAVVANPNYFAYSEVKDTDATVPTFESLSASVAEDGSVTIAAQFVDNLPAADSVKVVIDGTEYALATSATAVPATYTATISTLTPNKTYDYSILYGSTAGSSLSRTSDGPFYTGVVSVAQTKDADELSLTDGAFTVSRADAGSALRVDYTVSGTATADADYDALSGSVVIPAGATSAEIVVKPRVNSATEENVSVIVTLVAGAYAVSDATKSATVTVVNAEANPYIQFVSPSGSDSNDGYTVGTPKLTIAAALSAIAIPDEGTAEVILAAGTYKISASVLLDKAVLLRGSTGNPDDVVISKASGDFSLVTLNHEAAKVQDLTVSAGSCTVDGGAVYINSNGGVVEHCILNGGNNGGKYGKAGGNVYMKAGTVTRSVIRNAISNYNGGGGGVWMSGGQVESSLIYGNSAATEQSSTYTGDNGGGVHLTSSAAKLVNCTLYLNRGASRPGVKIDYDSKAKAPKGSVINCVIVDNKTMTGTWDFFNVGGDNESAAGFVNCLTDAAVAQPNATCFGAPFGFVDRRGADYRLTAASTGVDAGTAVTLYSNLDLDGNPRVSGDAIDVGCYELQQTAPKLYPGVSDEEVLVNEEVTFTAGLKGGSAEGDITWDFGDGETGTGASCTHAFATPGWKTVTVTATINGATVSMPVAKLVKVCAKEIYLNAAGSATPPYDTVEKGATDFATAFAEATDGTTLYVTNGVYLTTSQTILNKAIRVVGIGDDVASVVITNKAASRIFYMSNKEAALCNLTIAGGKTLQSPGANVFLLGHGGTISNCVITAGFGDNYGATSGNLTMESADALVTHCVISKGKINNNGGGSKGCNVNMSAGRLAHSLIVEGTDSGMATNPGVAGGVRISGGTMTFCTVANNTSQTTGGIYASGGLVLNCIIAGNKSTVTGGDAAAFQKTGSPSISNCYSDTISAINDSCFTALDDELIADAANGNYRAAVGAPTIDKGLPGADETLPATDLAGNPRVMGSAVDVGCYEYEPPAFAVSFSADATTGYTPKTVVFTASVEGADEGDVLRYSWDFDGDGVADAVTTEPTVSYVFTAGAIYSVSLTVTDVTKGLSGTFARENYIKTTPKVIYVDCAVENPVAPYATWETAANRLADAIEAAIDGCEIIIRAGEYQHTVRPVVEKTLDIHSETQNPADVVIRSTTWTGVLYMNGKGSKISGVTFSDGLSAANTDAGLHFGANGGTVSNCVVRGCYATNWNGNGPAIYSTLSDDALITHCVIQDCSLEGSCGGSSKYIVYLGRGRLENSLVKGCFAREKESAPADSPVALMHLGANASVVNCTFVDNNMRYRGLLHFDEGAGVTNCVFADNAFLTPAQMAELGLPEEHGGFVFSGNVAKPANTDALVNCAMDLAEPVNASCVTGTRTTFFMNYETEMLTPVKGGPLYNAGVDYSDMPSVDLSGRARKVGKHVDIGCYEAQSDRGFILLVR